MSDESIANVLIRELRRKLPAEAMTECCVKDFGLYKKILAQQPKGKNKIYSLHEQQVYCFAKEKDRVQYEYCNKIPIASTAKSNIIVGAVSHETNIFDGHTLPEVLEHIEVSRGKAVLQAVCDRGYRGVREVNGIEIILPKKARYQRDKKRKQCRR